MRKMTVSSNAIISSKANSPFRDTSSRYPIRTKLLVIIPAYNTASSAYRISDILIETQKWIDFI